MGRAAGGDRLLPAALRLSRLLPAARRPEPARADQLDARADLRPQPLRRDPAARAILQYRRRARRAAVGCLQNRGEYMFVAQGSGGFRVYDIASIANKGFSERIITAPFSPLGQDTHVAIAQRHLHGAADQPADPAGPQRRDGRDAARRSPTARPSPCSRRIRSSASTRSTDYAVVTDAEEGLILVNVDTLADGEARNNLPAPRQLRQRRQCLERERRADRRPAHHARAAIMPISPPMPAWSCVDLDDPLAPRVTATVPLNDARASALQFRYLWVTDADGLKLFDVTHMDQPVAVPSADGAVRRRAPRLSRPHLCLCRRRRRGPGHRQRHPAGAARRLLADAEVGLLAGQTPDTQDVIVASTNASLFAYVADGRNGMKVLQLTSPETQSELLRLLAAAGARADRLGAHPVPGACSVARASTATARWTRPAARSRSSAASARARSTAARWSACTSTAGACPIRCSDTRLDGRLGGAGTLGGNRR